MPSAAAPGSRRHSTPGSWRHVTGDQSAAGVPQAPPSHAAGNVSTCDVTRRHEAAVCRRRIDVGFWARYGAGRRGGRGCLRGFGGIQDGREDAGQGRGNAYSRVANATHVLKQQAR